MELEEAFRNRRSCRAFRPEPAPRATLERVLTQAQSAPSWCNIQPWRVWLASGAKRDLFVAQMLEAASGQMPAPHVPFPLDYPEPYGAHRKACARALYESMGVARDDGAARHAAWLRNFVAFDAPHVAMVGIDSRFGLYAALDVGCWLEALFLALHAEGLAACAQASLALYPDVARSVLGVPEGITLLFGVAMGYEDTEAAANRCRTTREPIDANVTFLD